MQPGGHACYAGCGCAVPAHLQSRSVVVLKSKSVRILYSTSATRAAAVDPRRAARNPLAAPLRSCARSLLHAAPKLVRFEVCVIYIQRERVHRKYSFACAAAGVHSHLRHDICAEIARGENIAKMQAASLWRCSENSHRTQISK
jgi:hypothetical protein